jgi:hypothetical protein
LPGSIFKNFADTLLQVSFFQALPESILKFILVTPEVQYSDQQKVYWLICQVAQSEERRTRAQNVRVQFPVDPIPERGRLLQVSFFKLCQNRF